MNVAAMGPHEAFPCAPGGLHTIYRYFTYFYSELDEFSHVLEQYVPVWFTQEPDEKAKWAWRYLKKSSGGN